MWETIEVTKREHYAIVTLNRPDALNALSTQMAKDIIAVMDELSKDIDVWAVVLSGAGERAFCVGADLKERKSMTKDEMIRQRELFCDAFEAVVRFPKPIVAMVNGFAMGGGFEFALCCDMIVAAEEAFLGLPEVGLGIIPGGGGTQNLPRIIGKNKAKELIYTGRKISGQTAFEWGIANKVAPRGQLMEATADLIREITKNAPLALQQAKRCVDLGVEVDLTAGMALEAEAYNRCLYSEDRDEGLKAFNEKRKPNYQGK
ncbi:enoyl-CoA hydratase/isomerase family protein [Dethiobacter alkaliphilus]|uniref:enoyl-CoA hydratase/isomerase family protein n=1 Tax=Dethiobacter alkaliphilus TaxID=427926 RepID=UPI0022277FA1|nr:enoyl-CoA hydratase-related protein [Dethiobacter alkaliphilus]MCW3488779.1 enoyl-CoA hydratase-related protein [Dethiobacter alkaliphilus]